MTAVKSFLKNFSCLKIKHINMMNIKDSNVVVEIKKIIYNNKLPLFKKEK